MKHYKIISIVAIIALISIGSCKKKDVRPTKSQVATTTKAINIAIENNPQSNRHAAGDYDFSQVERFIEIAQRIGDNRGKAVGFDLEYDGINQIFKMKNLRVLLQSELPDVDIPNVDRTVVICVDGDFGGTNTECGTNRCQNRAIKQCLGGGGCAVVCPIRIIPIIYIPHNVL